jgi:hypothetical protein
VTEIRHWWLPCRLSLAHLRQMGYREAKLIECRRNLLRYARSFPPTFARNQHRQVAVSTSRPVQEQENGLAHTRLKAPATAVDRCYFTRACISQLKL